MPTPMRVVSLLFMVLGASADICQDVVRSSTTKEKGKAKVSIADVESCARSSEPTSEEARIFHPSITRGVHYVQV